jgi:hypothetical protein
MRVLPARVLVVMPLVARRYGYAPISRPYRSDPFKDDIYDLRPRRTTKCLSSCSLERSAESNSSFSATYPTISLIAPLVPLASHRLRLDALLNENTYAFTISTLTFALGVLLTYGVVAYLVHIVRE